MFKNKMSLTEIKSLGLKIKYDLFEKFCKVQEGHPGSVLSIFDIVNYLYLSEALSIKVGSNKNDTLIMSKGHAAAVQYPYLVRLGIIDRKEWDNWGKNDSILRVFGNNSIPGIDVTSGSLGYGVGIAAGMAIANRHNKIPTEHFVIISEGELYEGSTWEALIFVAHHKLKEIKIILDINRNMILGRPEDHLSLESFEAKFQAFNFNTKRINGHNYEEIEAGIEFLKSQGEQPRVLLADTIKGKGVSFMEDRAESHYWGGLSDEQMKIMLEELK